LIVSDEDQVVLLHCTAFKFLINLTTIWQFFSQKDTQNIKRSHHLFKKSLCRVSGKYVFEKLLCHFWPVLLVQKKHYLFFRWTVMNVIVSQSDRGGGGGFNEGGRGKTGGIEYSLLYQKPRSEKRFFGKVALYSNNCYCMLHVYLLGTYPACSTDCISFW
jgi:hypothetical protein